MPFKVYCENCKYYQAEGWRMPEGQIPVYGQEEEKYYKEKCKYKLGEVDTYRRREQRYPDPQAMNANNDCHLYEKKG